MKRTPFILAAAVASVTSHAQIELPAHPPPPLEGVATPGALFFDLRALRDPVVVTALTTGMDSFAGQPFQFELLIRDGTCLGGSTTNGPGASLSGWTSLGMVQGMQGPQNGGLSLRVDLPRFEIQPGRTVGVALWFHGFDGARDFVNQQGTNEEYQDQALRLTTGEAWGYPFTVGPYRFSGRMLVGSIFYQLAPCYPNCDGSTAAPVLNVNDFLCFMSEFAAGDSYANCDSSTPPPELNVNDFLCFTQQFAGGCS
jgi:hypothetical protein